MINQIVLVGRLVRDVDLKYTPSGGKAVANFTLAVDRSFTSRDGKKEADFIRVVVWEKTAENCANYIGKGSMVGVTGRLQVRNYEGKDGQKKTVAEVVAGNVQFLDRGEKKQDREPDPEDFGGEVTDDDVPF